MSKLFKNKWIYDVMDQLSFKKLTEIQKKTIPLIKSNKNVIGVDKTGTGKTYCFLLPIFDRIDYSINKLQSIIILPTRELAKQIYNKSQIFKKNCKNLTISLLVGGVDNEQKMISLSKNSSHILIGTPKKIFEFFNNYKVDFNYLNSIVLDEADMLIDLGFFGLIDTIFKQIKNFENIQKIAFSATLHEMLSAQLSKYLKNVNIVDLSVNIWKHQKIEHNLIHFQDQKIDVLKSLINVINPYFCIIFANHKKTVDEIYSFLYSENKSVLKLHGGLTSRERKNAFKEIQKNNLNFLVATDVASRGIDIEGVSHVISYDLPKEDIWYIHRSGRTGRFYNYGTSYVFFDKNNQHIIKRLQKKGINWINKKFYKNEFIDFDYVLKSKKKKETIVDVEIKKIIQTANKKVKPNYKKKIELQIKEVKRKAKRQRIEELVNKERIKRYKIENAKKNKIKNK